MKKENLHWKHNLAGALSRKLVFVGFDRVLSWMHKFHIKINVIFSFEWRKWGNISPVFLVEITTIGKPIPTCYCKYSCAFGCISIQGKQSEKADKKECTWQKRGWNQCSFKSSSHVGTVCTLKLDRYILFSLSKNIIFFSDTSYALYRRITSWYSWHN